MSSGWSLSYCLFVEHGLSCTLPHNLCLNASLKGWECLFSLCAKKSRFFMRGQGSFLCSSCFHRYWWKSLFHPDLRLVLRLPSQWLLFGFIWRGWSRISVGEMSFPRPWRQMWHSGLTKSKHTQGMCWTRMRNETTQDFKKPRYYANFWGVCTTFSSFTVLEVFILTCLNNKKELVSDPDLACFVWGLV